MPQFSTTRHVKHPASDMFDLVADVEKYPEFVPLCQSLKIRKRTESEDGKEVLIADMSVAYKLIRERFTSRVTLDRPNLKIHVSYLDGPFSRMENRWGFVATGARESDVLFSIDYDFKSRTLGMLMGAVFEAAFRRFSAAFETRANEVYGKPA
ncbi:MAG TPA: SRPBCC family protein [Xanthobacteraceae bacterium]|jgi:coenzyme Q-binding protein COQ10|nr:SRPBCC family protein [Xanthobacteraceae bacterium]